MKYLFFSLIVILGFYIWFTNNTINQKETIIKHLEDSLSSKIDTLIINRDIVQNHYITSKQYVYKLDKKYIPGKDSICDSLVVALKNSLKTCDTVINISDTLIKTLLVRDTVRINHIHYLDKKSKFSLIVGPTLSLTPQGIQPGIGISFGIKLK
jgi:hypothetical protein